MERVYFSINEAGAKTANDMMSFSEYKTGSKTAGYKAQVDKAYELAEKVIEARPTEEERVSKLCERYSRRLAQNINKDIIERDHRDMTRETSPLKQADDAVLLDSSDMTIDEVVDRMKQLVKEA